jgi:putative hydrolase of the HAD superfamily
MVKRPGYVDVKVKSVLRLPAHLRRLLRRHGLAASRCILVEDTLVNLKRARQLGVRTAWVTQYLRYSDPIGKAPLPKMVKRPGYVDVKVKSVLRLPAHLRRLTHRTTTESF